MVIPVHSNPQYQAEAPPVYEQQAQGSAAMGVPGRTMAYCKGCGRQFAPKGVNPASAQYHRCEDCNKRQTREMICVNLTCGASSLCVIQ